MNLVLAGYVKYIEFSHLAIFGYFPRGLKTWGLVYVDVCVAFKALVMTFPILGGLFQVYRWVFRI
jgi:hypothetical protein